MLPYSSILKEDTLYSRFSKTAFSSKHKCHLCLVYKSLEAIFVQHTTRTDRISSKKPTFAHFGKALFPPIDAGLSTAPRTNLGWRHRFPQGFSPVESNHNLPHDRSGSQPAIRKDHEIPPTGFGSSFFEAIRSVSQAEHPVTPGKHTADMIPSSRVTLFFTAVLLFTLVHSVCPVAMH